ncbi:MAG: hypothetical protein MZV49_08020 [Rhodopseudomonas palustris]|nr:hypothetical protein [Rhodopseudomonas palustris]
MFNDIVMPGMSGLELGADRTQPLSGSCPVVLASGYSDRSAHGAQRRLCAAAKALLAGNLLPAARAGAARQRPAWQHAPRAVPVRRGR